MKTALYWILCAALLGGCAATYRHPTKSADAFEKDRRACEAVARKTLAAKGIPGT